MFGCAKKVRLLPLASGRGRAAGLAARVTAWMRRMSTQLTPSAWRARRERRRARNRTRRVHSEGGRLRPKALGPDAEDQLPLPYWSGMRRSSRQASWRTSSCRRASWPKTMLSTNARLPRQSNRSVLYVLSAPLPSSFTREQAIAWPTMRASRSRGSPLQMRPFERRAWPSWRRASRGRRTVPPCRRPQRRAPHSTTRS